MFEYRLRCDIKGDMPAITVDEVDAKYRDTIKHNRADVQQSAYRITVVDTPGTSSTSCRECCLVRVDDHDHEQDQNRGRDHRLYVYTVRITTMCVST
jgi:hypothetical protein